MDAIARARKGLGPVIRLPLLGAACLAAATGWTIDGAAQAARAESRAPATALTAPQAAQDDAAAGAGAYTGAQAERGRAIYREHCLACHGSSLRGGVNEFAAPALAGPFFFDAWSGRPVAELLAYSAENMPPEGTLLPEPDYLDVIAYVLQVLGYPEGDAELTAGSPALAKGIERRR